VLEVESICEGRRQSYLLRSFMGIGYEGISNRAIVSIELMLREVPSNLFSAAFGSPPAWYI